MVKLIFEDLNETIQIPGVTRNHAYQLYISSLFL